MSSYNYSYNVLINRFEAFAAGHLLIKRFTHGQIDLSDQLNDDQYPFMHVTPDTIEPTKGAMQFGFHIMFADIPRDKETKAEYQREVISDCVRLGQDLIAEITNGLTLFGFNVQMIGDVVFEPFMEEQKNTVTGVAFTIKLEVPWDWSACDIPAVWAVGGESTGGSGSPIGLLLQVNGVNNAVQSELDLVAGTNITLTDNGDGSVTIDSTGGGGGGSGTVTSVGLSAPAAFNVSGSPVTTSGTLAITAAGNASQYITGAGALQTFPTIPAAQVNSDWNAVSGVAEILNKPLIPTELRDLTDVDITSPAQNDTLLFNALSNEFQNGQLGAAAYSNDYNDLSNLPAIPAAQIQSDWTQANTAALDYIKNKPTLPATIGDMTKAVYDQLDVGIVESAHKEMVGVINKTGASVPKGSIVYLKSTSASGTHPEIVLATATTEVGSSKTIGAVYEDIANDATGYVVTSGEVRNLDTSAYSIGDRLWLGTTAGSVTTTPPSEPNHTVFIGTVTRSQNINGRVLYAIQNGYELDELHGVQITSVASNDVLMYDGGTSLWKNFTLANLKSLLGLGTTVLASDFSNAGTAGYEDVTAFSFAVTSGKTYKWRATIAFTATSQGNFSINGPATTFNRYRFTTANTATANLASNQIAYNLPATNATILTGVSTADGIIKPSASGNVIMRVRGASIGGVTVLAGSIIEFEEVL